MVRIADDLTCKHLGRLGVIEEVLRSEGFVRREPVYFVRFVDPSGGAHGCYESEIALA
jgi:hypothetical protein